MKTDKRNSFSKMFFRFIRWLRKRFNFLFPIHINVDLGRK